MALTAVRSLAGKLGNGAKPKTTWYLEHNMKYQVLPKRRRSSLKLVGNVDVRNCFKNTLIPDKMFSKCELDRSIRHQKHILRLKNHITM